MLATRDQGPADADDTEDQNEDRCNIDRRRIKSMVQRTPTENARQAMQKDSFRPFRQTIAEVVFGPDAAEGDRRAVRGDEIQRAKRECDDSSREHGDARSPEEI